MQTFVYKAKDADGNITEGSVRAHSEAEAVTSLTSQGIFPISISEAADADKASVPSRSVSIKHLAVFTGQLAHLLKGGLPLLKALMILEQQTAHQTLRHAMRDVSSAIQGGQRFSEALSVYEHIFGRFYVSMVRAAEVGGNLDYVLELLAEELEKDSDLRSRISSACVYPSIIFGVGVLTVLVVMLFVVPRMSAMYDELGQSLPFITAALVSVSEFMLTFWWLVLAAIAVCVYGVRTLFRLSSVKLGIGRIVLTAPIWGKLWQKADLIRMTKTLGMLLKSGVPYLEALAISEAVVHNALFKHALADAQDSVRQGIALSAVCGNAAVFPPLVTQLVAVGEESGSIDVSLFRIAEVYEKEVDRYVKILVTLIEPLLILLIGGGVALLAAAMILPILNMSTLIQ